MDPYERAPVNYGRDVVMVQTASATVAAWTYFANDAVRRPGLAPRRSYLDHLLAGASYLSDEYLAWLAAIRCAAEPGLPR
jgi:hypothetical protein